MTDPADDPRSDGDAALTSERDQAKSGGDPRADDVFPPTLREVMLRPRWLTMLALCLVVAGVFAWLGQWQLGRAVDTDPLPPGATEQVQPIAEITAPGEYLPEPFVGQRVSVAGAWVPGDFLVVEQRFNDGAKGFWVTGQLRLAEGERGDDTAPASLAVAIGWAQTRDAAARAIEQLEASASVADADPVALTGRLVSDEGPAPPPRGADPQTMTRMSPPALLALWHDIDELDVYRPYLTAAEPAVGLVAIHSPAPAEGSAVNWLNIFYAIEWAVFAGFAFYLWYRLAKDAWEREVESIADGDASTRL